MKKIIIILGIFIFLILAGVYLLKGCDCLGQPVPPLISNFEDCVAAGYPILESYPRQCTTPDDKIFVEDIGNELEKIDLIRIDSPRPNSKIKTPLAIKGKAKEYWFFEGDFPVKLLDENGIELGTAVAQALSEWMTEDFVAFETTLDFQTPATNRGVLILEKDNPSGLPENADELIVPIYFAH